jgi:hypothetical protein
MMLLPAPTSAASAVPAQDQEKINNLLMAADAFRQAVLADPQTAFAKYAPNEQASRYRAMSSQLFLDESPDLLWRSFLKSSLLSASFHGLDQALIAFYQPWTDIFLLTEWKNEAGSPRIQHMRFVHGDALRKRGEPPYNISPLWSRSTLPAYAAVSLDTTKTLRSFDKLFPTKLQPKGTFAWEPKLGLDKDPARSRANEVAVRGAFTAWVLTSQTFFDDRRFEKVRKKISLALDAIKTEQSANLLAEASETLPETATVLGRPDGLAFVRDAKLQTMAYSKKHCFVFLTNPAMPHVYLSFWLDGGLDSPRLRRVDLMDLQQAYQKLPVAETAKKKKSKH